MVDKSSVLGAVALALLLGGCGREPQGPPPLSPGDVRGFLQDSGLEKSALSAYIRGKVLVINRTEGSIEASVQTLLAPDRNAQTARDVETVVWIDWSTQPLPGESYKTVFQKGQSKKIPSVVWNADLTVIDWTRKQILGGPRITGTGPKEHYEKRSEEELLNAGGIAGPRPYQEVADYLAETARAIAIPP